MKTLARWIATVGLAAGAMFAPVPAAFATALPLGGPWVILDQVMSPGDFFTAPDAGIAWTFTCPTAHCLFYITDLFVISDQFEVWDNGVLIATTPAVPDWDGLGYGGPGVGGPFPPWTPDPDVAFGSGLYSGGVILVDTGDHSISIKDIHIPPISAGGPPFGDGTVAFKVAVPEPTTLALLGLALVGLGFARRRRS